MRRGAFELERALRDGGGVISRRGEPALTGSLDWAVRVGRLESLLPGVYARPEDRGRFEVRARALTVWDPDVVLHGAAAAKLTVWPSLDVPLIAAAASRDLRRAGYLVKRRRIPPELIREVSGVRCTTPAFTALDLCSTLGGDVLDTVLRTRAATLEQLHEAMAMIPSRRGNLDRRVLLLDSRDQPWSEAERSLHRILREAGLTGWRGNWEFERAIGRYWIDVAFPDLKLAVEVDGWEFHKTEEAFEQDRRRQNDLVLAGWRVLRFTAKMIRDFPQIVLATIEQALAG